MIVPYSILDKKSSGNFTYCEKENLNYLTGNEEGTIVVPRDCEFKRSKKANYIYSDNPKLKFLRSIKGFLADGEIKKREITIGNNFVTHETSWIATDGFGVVKNEEGDYERFPQIGGLVIGNNVELGAYSLINRGALGDTTIGDNVFIGHHSVIGHNCKIGNNVFIPTNCTIGGGAIISDGCTFGVGVIVNPKTILANNIVIGSGSIITRSFLEENILIFGSPAKKKREIKINEKIKGLPRQ